MLHAEQAAGHTIGRLDGDAAPRPAKCPRCRKRPPNPDQVVGVGHLHRCAHLGRAEPTIDQHGNCAHPPTGIQGDGEIDARRDHQGHPVADLHTTRAEEALGGALHHIVELAERDRAAVGTHLPDRNPIGDRRVPQRCAQIDRCRRRR